MNALVTAESRAVAMTEEEVMYTLQNSLYPGASPASIKLVMSYCKAASLDAMQKPVHIVPMWDSKSGSMRDVVMPGIGLYRTQAARSGCAGVSEPEFGPDITEEIGGQTITFPAWCRVTVKRRLPTGEVVDFTAKELWKENYAIKGGKEKSIAPNAMWTKRPYGQLAKCAEAQALRKAFPEVGSAPTADEMMGKSLDDAGEVAPSTSHRQEAEPVQRAIWPDEAFEAQFSRWSKAVASGIKSPADILAMAKTKGELTTQQEARIKSLKTADATDVTPNTEHGAE